jgi:importin subunit alpha-1
VERQALKALSACLSFTESKVLIVCMEGIENILKAGDKDFRNANNENIFALEFEVCGGVDKLEQLQLHQNNKVYEKALKILEAFYSTDADGDNLMDVINS